jgi:hypothetical protein
MGFFNIYIPYVKNERLNLKIPWKLPQNLLWKCENLILHETL